MKWTAYCIANGRTREAFASTFESDFLPREGDEICLERGQCCCEMRVLHCTWHCVDGKLQPTVQLEPGGGCFVKDFVGLGWEPA
jgi:hypothetical protein